VASTSPDARFKLPKGAGARDYSCQIIKPYTALRRRPAARGPLDTELLFGQTVDVYSVLKGWALVKAKPLIKGPKRAHYVGYVKASALGGKTRAKTNASITALTAPVFVKADIKSHIVMALPMNSAVRILSEDDKIIRMDKGYIHTSHVSRVPVQTDFVSIAERFMGRPYIWGGTGGLGVDCSGLVQMALCAAGIDSPRDADQQELHLGAEIKAAKYQRGDLIFWPGHVGIMQNGKKLLHANAFHMETASEPVKTAIKRIGPPRRAKRLG